ncbi:agenet domain containing protein [Musa troglodytarum]|uniref:Agenet domain containing protein n=1 Tax=Musa troglodytarum TaxID=320322 RepID=A0A9E7FBP4_9LILI|nr:agenet domain containing protein [Musa troglodytarum]
MRFKKGNKVEVWNRREVPSGAWSNAEIVSGNGDNYSVRYDGYPTDSSLAVDRVPGKSIRPCPPSAVGLKDLMSGDVVEVFDINSWKLAEVLMVVDKNSCLVRLIGSSRELRADKSLVRSRLSWQDNKWMMIYKDSRKENGWLLSNLSRQEKFGYRNCLPSENHGSPEKTRCIFSIGTKKRPFYSPAETCNADRRKIRAIEKDGRCQGIIAGQLIQCLDKVDAVAYPRRVLVDKCTCPSLCHGTTGLSKMVLRRGTQSSNKQKSLIRSSEPSDAESTSSSIGSCSVGSSPFRPLQNEKPQFLEDMLRYQLLWVSSSIKLVFACLPPIGVVKPKCHYSIIVFDVSVRKKAIKQTRYGYSVNILQLLIVKIFFSFQCPDVRHLRMMQDIFVRDPKRSLRDVINEFEYQNCHRWPYGFFLCLAVAGLKSLCRKENPTRFQANVDMLMVIREASVHASPGSGFVSPLRPHVRWNPWQRSTRASVSQAARHVFDGMPLREPRPVVKERAQHLGCSCCEASVGRLSSVAARLTTNTFHVGHVFWFDSCRGEGLVGLLFSDPLGAPLQPEMEGEIAV